VGDKVGAEPRKCLTANCMGGMKTSPYIYLPKECHDLLGHEKLSEKSLKPAHH